MRSADAAAHTSLLTWTAARDAVLRGLVHALSNRVGTVVAVGGLLEAGSAEVAGRVLVGEAERMEVLLAQFRSMTADPFGDGATREPVVVAEVAAEAVALHAYAGDAGGPSIAPAGLAPAGLADVPPVLVSRAGLLHALVVLLAGSGGAAGLRAEPGASGNVRLRAEPPAGAEAVGAAVWLLAESGARADEGGALLLPPLLLPPFGIAGTSDARARRP